MIILSAVNQSHVLSISFRRSSKLWVQRGMSSVRLCFLSVHNCLFLPGSLNCCSQVNRVDRMPPSSVYLYESGLQNQAAVVTYFCMSEVGLLPRALCCYVAMHGGCGSLALSKSCDSLTTVRVTAIPSQHYARHNHLFSQETWHVLCFPF